MGLTLFDASNGARIDGERGSRHVAGSGARHAAGGGGQLLSLALGIFKLGEVGADVGERGGLLLLGVLDVVQALGIGEGDKSIEPNRGR